MGYEKLTPLSPAYRSARLLSRAYSDHRSLGNVAYLMPNPRRDYVISFDKTITMPPSGEYHPPNPEISEEKREEYRLRSLKRARRKFLNLALANDFRFMLTLTLNPKHPKFDVLNNKNRIRQTFKDIHRNQKHTYSYLGVCELQKNGNCHLHIIATKQLKKYLVKNEHGKDAFIPWIKYGFTNIRKINQKDYERQTAYLTKYLFKQPEDLTYNYFRSLDLETPTIKYNIDEDNFIVDTSFQTEYGIRVTKLKRG